MPSCWAAAVETRICPLETGRVASPPFSSPCFSAPPPHQCASAPVLCEEHLLVEGLVLTGEYPLNTRHGSCTYIQTESILLCSPKIIMSHHLPHGCHQLVRLLVGGSKADQSFSCLWMAIFQIPEGCTVFGLLCSSLVACSPLSSPIRGHPPTQHVSGP